MQHGASVPTVRHLTALHQLGEFGDHLAGQVRRLGIPSVALAGKQSLDQFGQPVDPEHGGEPIRVEETFFDQERVLVEAGLFHQIANPGLDHFEGEFGVGGQRGGEVVVHRPGVPGAALLEVEPHQGVRSTPEGERVVTAHHAVPLGEVGRDQRVVGDVGFVHRSDVGGSLVEQTVTTRGWIPLQGEVGHHLGQRLVDSQHRSGDRVVGRTDVGVGKSIRNGAVQEPPQPGDEPVETSLIPRLVPERHQQGVDVPEVDRIRGDRGDVVVQDLQQCHRVFEVLRRVQLQEFGSVAQRHGVVGQQIAGAIRRRTFVEVADQAGVQRGLCLR